MTGNSDLRRLDALAASRGGLFTREEARACGFSDDQIRRRVRRQDWQVVLGQVLARAGRRITPLLRDRAALLAVPDAALSGQSAARRYGLDVPDLRPSLVVAPGRQVRLAGVVIRRERLDAEDLLLVDGVLLTTPMRTVVDCVRALAPVEADLVLDRALQRRLITYEEFVSQVHRLVGRHGVRKLVQAVARHAHGARSVAERLLVQGLRRGRIGGWQANLAVYDADGLIGEVDFGFSEIRLAVEVDGRAWHSAGDRFQRDRARQNRLVRAGWTVLRFTWHDLTEDMDGVLRQIAAVRRQLADYSPRTPADPRGPRPGGELAAKIAVSCQNLGRTAVLDTKQRSSPEASPRGGRRGVCRGGAGWGRGAVRGWVGGGG
ncbi:type IV toxin-antitoxin system AbiEi family antitoxin domain-containing protein [Catellatospora vulcania]|uniref:type IV toxin-antitoxin system AbiEi family antitoxin domain-containing protein n=1 Tax=Catellatospora vulcania TaxID=1460450 RepID=UPI0012D418F0|nr:type IV toxin-antitoxin system AbiEi family antitoxin domain-containing protein [Catellatospora vulcania]